MKKHNKHRLQTRFFFYYFGVCGALIVGFFAFFYSYSYNILLNEGNKTLHANVVSLMEQCQTKIMDLDSVSINFQYSAGIRNLLGSQNLDVTTVNRDDFAELCVTLNGAESKSDLIVLYDYNGNVISSGSYTVITSYNEADHEWINSTLSSGGSKLISESKTIDSAATYSFINQEYISLYRGFFNSFGEQVGALEVAKLSKAVFFPIFSFVSGEESPANYYVYNSSGELIFPYDIDSDSIYNYYTTTLGQEENYIYENPTTNSTEIISHVHDHFTDWTYIAVQSQAEVMQPITDLTEYMVLAIIIVLLLILALTYFMSYSVLQPIRRLQENINNTQLENLAESYIPLEKNSYVELELLNDTFNKMGRSLKTSMDELIETRQQEQKSRFLALQSQINPHFYFNTLSSLIVLAEDEKTKDVITMCRNLTSMMRYVSNSEDIVVTLGEELDYIKKYLYCMKIRYQSSLTYSIDIAEELQSEIVPRLIIQPIVENAIKYGTNTTPPWHFSITGHHDSKGWYIEIEDSGNGFTNESLAQIEQRIKDAEINGDSIGLHVDGMGTLNVYMRWKLFCETGSIFKVGNTEAGNGIVKLGRRYDEPDV